VLGLVPEDLNIRRREPGIEQPPSERFGGVAGMAGGVAGVDLDELLQDVALEQVGIVGLRGEREHRCCGERGGKQQGAAHGLG